MKITSGQCARGYFENLKALAQKEGIDHNSKAFKVLFFRNLIPDNKKEAIRFGIEKPINEIIEHLDDVSNTFNEFKSIIERTIQGPDSVKLFYLKLKWHSKLIGYNNNEVYIKQQFLRGLSPENQIEAKRCGLDLPLDELVEKLSKNENIRNILIAEKLNYNQIKITCVDHFARKKQT